MLTRVFSAAVYGVNAVEVEIEVNAGAGAEPKMIIVGLPDVAVRESKDRVTTAINNSGYSWPIGRTTINLAPADIKKEGPSFDLPIALGMISITQNFPPEVFRDFCIVGELALNGQIRPVKGILPIALEARRKGRRFMIVAPENAKEASIVRGIEVYPIGGLHEAFEFLRGGISVLPVQPDRSTLFEKHRQHEIDFSEVKGQIHVKRALEVAAAGGHNVLMVGPPGTGKSMLAKRIPTIMPRMTEENAIETTKIHSVAGLLGEKTSIVATRPFRSPHHTISDAGLLGGSQNPSPGEVSLAHHGVLFLDELPEFRRSTLEVLRQPLEDGQVTISRAAGSLTFPSQFMLVAAMNPCPCGYYGDPKRECRCGTNQIVKYRQKISGPLLDRIDLHVEVPIVEFRELTSGATGEPSEAIRERVEACRQIQSERFSKIRVSTNSAMPSKMMKEHCAIDNESHILLEQVMQELNFSARAYDRILKVARTLADLEAKEKIESNHIMEAVQYRTLDRKLWV